MATGQSLMLFLPQSIEPTATNFAPINMRNVHPVLEFATATGNRARWTGVMPSTFSSSAVGVTAVITWAMATATATTGQVAWLLSYERLTATQDIDSDGFGATTTATLVATPSVSGVTTTSSISTTATADRDGIVAGDVFRFQLTRHVATDTATGKAQVLSVELRES